MIMIQRNPFTYCDWRIHPLYITLFYKNLSRTQTDQNKPTMQLEGKSWQYALDNTVFSHVLPEVGDLLMSYASDTGVMV